MRISLLNFMEKLGFNQSKSFDWADIKKVLNETGILYYAFQGDLQSYGYIDIKHLPEVLEQVKGSYELDQKILANPELWEIFEKKGVRSKKWGKLLNIFIGYCPQSTIDHFMVLLQVQNNDPEGIVFKILDDVQDAYNSSNLSSCMTDQDLDLVQLYKILGVQYLQQLDTDGNEISRSLLWPNVRKLSSDADDDKFEMVKLCDRIYSKSIQAYASHVKHVNGLGYHVRYLQNHDGYSQIWAPGEGFKYANGETLLEFKLSDSGIALDDLKGIPWPYLDTFRFWMEKDQTFRNYTHASFYWHRCDTTNGESPYCAPKEECAECGAECDPENMSNIDGYLYCTDCYNVCDVCGEAYRHNDLHEVRVKGLDHICARCLDRSDKYVRVEPTGHVINRDDAVYCDDVGAWFRYTDDWAYCVSDDSRYRSYDHLVLFEYEYYLPDCPKLKELQEKARECEVSV